MADQIPTELIDYVFSFAVLLDRRTSAAICRVNKHGRSIATPHLYEEVGTHGRAPKRRQNLSKLCRTLVTNRDLASRVRKVTQCIDRDTAKLLTTRSWPIETVDWERLSEELGSGGQAIDPYIKELCTGKLGGGLEDNLICMLLLACPMVQVLELQGHVECLIELDSFRTVLLLQAEASGMTRTMPSRNLLDSIAEVCLDGDRGASVGVVDCVLDLPGLKRIVIDRFTDHEDPEAELSRESHTLTDLEIKQCFAEIGNLVPLLDVFDNSRLLSLGWTDGIDPYREAEWRELGNILVNCTPLLEELRNTVQLSRSLWKDTDEGPIGCRGIGSLSTLAHLTTVVAPDFVLFGLFDEGKWRELDDEQWSLERLLPPSVDHLEIHCDFDELTGQEMAIFKSPGADKIAEFVIRNSTKTESITNQDVDRHTPWVSERAPRLGLH